MRLTKSFDEFARGFSRIAELYPEAFGTDPEYLEVESETEEDDTESTDFSDTQTSSDDSSLQTFN